MTDRKVRGLFAPSPPGPLHFGSLVAAVGSYLSARARGGAWRVRMEDLDPPREVKGAADDILRTLEGDGFEGGGGGACQRRGGARQRNPRATPCPGRPHCMRASAPARRSPIPACTASKDRYPPAPAVPAWPPAAAPAPAAGPPA